MTLRLLPRGPRLRWKVISHQTEEVIIIIIPILTTKRELQLVEFMSRLKSQRQKRQRRDLNSGLGAPRHKPGTTKPRCLPRPPSGLRFILASSPCLPSRVPARLWELENETPFAVNTGHGLASWGSLCTKNKMPFSPDGSVPCQGTWDSGPLNPWPCQGLK